MTAVTMLATHAAIWLVLAFAMTCSVRTRKMGVAVIVPVLVAYIVTDLILKPIVDRPRPFEVLDLQLIVDTPSTSSFPSGHTASSFAAAAAVVYYNRRWGIPALLFASAVGISRIYLGVHWPTDVLAGAAVGVVAAFVSIRFMDRLIPYFRDLPDPRSFRVPFLEELRNAVLGGGPARDSAGEDRHVDGLQDLLLGGAEVLGDLGLGIDAVVAHPHGHACERDEPLGLLVEGAVVDHDPVHDGYGVHQGRIELVDGLEGLGGVVAHVPVHFAEGAPSGASIAVSGAGILSHEVEIAFHDEIRRVSRYSVR